MSPIHCEGVLRVDFDALFVAAAGLLEAGEPDDRSTGGAFVNLMAAIVAFDYSVVFAYRGEERPIDLYSTFSPEEYEIFVRLYQEGPYLLDPFFIAASLPKPGVWRMRALAPDRFFASEYYRSYYEKTGLSEEIGFFVPLEEGITVVLSLMRREESGAFKDADFVMMRKVEPLVAALVRRNWNGLAPRFNLASKAGGKPTPQTSVSARAWMKQKLTARETGIIELVLQGHSSESIGLRLGVATGTVKVHRRNIYRKLGISSQSQLMSIYLDNLKRLG